MKRRFGGWLRDPVSEISIYGRIMKFHEQMAKL